MFSSSAVAPPRGTPPRDPPRVPVRRCRQLRGSHPPTGVRRSFTRKISARSSAARGGGMNSSRSNRPGRARRPRSGLLVAATTRRRPSDACASARLKPVHLAEELRQQAIVHGRSLAAAGGSRADESVELIEKHDGRRRRARSGEERSNRLLRVAHPLAVQLGSLDGGKFRRRRTPPRARASSWNTPGGPYRRMPLGGLAPTRDIASGCLSDHSTASFRRCFTSPRPPTSSHATLGTSTATSRSALGRRGRAPRNRPKSPSKARRTRSTRVPDRSSDGEEDTDRPSIRSAAAGRATPPTPPTPRLRLRLGAPSPPRPPRVSSSSRARVVGALPWRLLGTARRRPRRRTRARPPLVSPPARL